MTVKIKITERDLMAVLEVAQRVAARTGRIAVPRWDHIEIVHAVSEADLRFAGEGNRPAIAVGAV
jgi:hypothetical protein